MISDRKADHKNPVRTLAPVINLWRLNR